MEETLQTMDDLIHRGKIHYFGGSNMTGYELKEYLDVARRMGLSSRMVTLQVKIISMFGGGFQWQLSSSNL